MGSGTSDTSDPSGGPGGAAAAAESGAAAAAESGAAAAADDPLRVTPGARARWLPPVDPDDPRHPARSRCTGLAWDGVVWGRLGRGDRAWACWDTVTDSSLSPWLAAERGRVLRELGLHDAARDLELDGLTRARDVVDTVMLRVSLAADALGAAGRSVEPVAAAERAAAMLATATPLLDELSPGPRAARQRLRAQWVRTEIALLRRAAVDLDELPTRGDDGPVYPDGYDHGSDFHRAKGLLFAGVAHDDAWYLRRAADLAPPALLWAVELALLDLGDDSAAGRALTVWDELVAPPGHEREVARSPAAVRLEHHR